jgi:cell division control protein 6
MDDEEPPRNSEQEPSSSGTDWTDHTPSSDTSPRIGEDPSRAEAINLPDDNEGDDQGLFEDLLSRNPIFEQKEVLRPAYTPDNLPHRDDQINDMATIMVSALRGDTPSNILVYGKTGTGKTASARFVSQELQTKSQEYEVPCEVEYINCEVTDTQYRVLAQLANQFIIENKQRAESELKEISPLLKDSSTERLNSHGFNSIAGVRQRIGLLERYIETTEQVPMTGWPTDRVYTEFFDAVDFYQRVLVIMLDEIDKLVEKSGDDTLYNLSRMNSDLEKSRVSMIGISNDLQFTDFLDPRVKSSLGEEEIVFPPYNANQLTDILRERAEIAYKQGVLEEGVIPLCSAFAAQEHGDARRALDLLRTAGEISERSKSCVVTEDHVREAQEQIELNRIVEAVRTLPEQSKLILLSIIRLEDRREENINTGKVFNEYKSVCDATSTDMLTQRRVTDLISELDMLGIVNAAVVSKGHYGRTKQISLSVPKEETRSVLTSSSRIPETESHG